MFGFVTLCADTVLILSPNRRRKSRSAVVHSYQIL